MMRSLGPAMVLILAGCHLPPEQLPLMPLPEDGPPLSYAETLARARSQAMAGTEAFFVNRWGDLEDAARGLEQTARFLLRAPDVPAEVRDQIPSRAKDLGNEAVELRLAAKARDEKRINDTLQRIHAKLRELRLEK